MGGDRLGEAGIKTQFSKVSRRLSVRNRDIRTDLLLEGAGKAAISFKLRVFRRIHSLAGLRIKVYITHDFGRAENRSRGFGRGGGKSEHQRARCRVTPVRPEIHAGGDAERRPDGKCHRKQTAPRLFAGAAVRVKRWGKSPPPRP